MSLLLSLSALGWAMVTLHIGWVIIFCFSSLWLLRPRRRARRRLPPNVYDTTA